MAKSNAERQAAYRDRRNSERICEGDLKLLLMEAYFVGRGDERDGRQWLLDGGLDDLYSRVCEAAAGTDLELERRYG